MKAMAKMKREWQQAETGTMDWKTVEEREKPRSPPWFGGDSAAP